jgi:hypothetical protein
MDMVSLYQCGEFCHCLSVIHYSWLSVHKSSQRPAWLFP